MCMLLLLLLLALASRLRVQEEGQYGVGRECGRHVHRCIRIGEARRYACTLQLRRRRLLLLLLLVRVVHVVSGRCRVRGWLGRRWCRWLLSAVVDNLG